MRPSALLNITEPMLAFQIDELVGTFGNHVHAQMNAQEGKSNAEVKAKREAVLNECLGVPPKYRSIRAAGRT